MAHDNKKPGTVVQAKSEKSWRKVVDVLVGELNASSTFSWPEKKTVPNGATGYITQIQPEGMFDWLIGVAFPEQNTMGWVKKDDLVVISPSEVADHQPEQE